MTRLLAALAASVIVGFGAFTAASAQDTPQEPRGQHEGMARGMDEMHRFCTSERMPQAMNGMMAMARQMGNGDDLAGMVRMMEMMSGMGQMGGQMDGTMNPTRPEPLPGGGV